LVFAYFLGNRVYQRLRILALACTEEDR